MRRLLFSKARRRPRWDSSGRDRLRGLFGTPGGEVFDIRGREALDTVSSGRCDPLANPGAVSPPDDPLPPAGRTRAAPVPPPPAAAALDRLSAAAPRLATFDPGSAGVRALVGVAVAAALVAGMFWWRSRPEPVPAPPRPTAAAQVVSATPTPRTIVVDVGGKVRDPGVVELPEGSRVLDAIEAAGGTRKGVDGTQLNMARPLVDGEQILVGVPASAAPQLRSSGGGAPGTDEVPLDLNSATADQLEELPGVGPVLAGRIVDYRDSHGGFRSVEQLRDVSGIGPKRYADLADRVRI